MLFISFPMWILVVTISMVWYYNANSNNYLEIDRETFRLQWKCGQYRRSIQGRTANLNRIEINCRYVGKNRRPLITCALIEGENTHRFGSILTPTEKEWLVTEVNNFLEKVNSSS